jgi:hypothetical protein
MRSVVDRNVAMQRVQLVYYETVFKPQRPCSLYSLSKCLSSQVTGISEVSGELTFRVTSYVSKEHISFVR